MNQLLQLAETNPWAATLIAMLVAVIGAIVAHRVGRYVLKRVFHHSALMLAVIKGIDRPAAAVLPLLALLMVMQFVPDGLPYVLRLRHLVLLGFVASLTWLVLGAISSFATAVVEQHPATVEDNLDARRIITQTRVLSRTAMVMVLIAGAAVALMTFPGARQVGASLLASAGVLGIVGGIAARPVFSNLIAGLQLALAQPLRIDDVLIVKEQFGRVEEITGTYVVLKLWDERRMIVPLQWFIENPFENWTRTGSGLHKPIFIYVDYAMPIEPLRKELERIVRAAPEWDGRNFSLNVTDSTEAAMQVRAVVSAHSSGLAFDLACKVREGLYAFMAREYPQFLPRTTVSLDGATPPPAAREAPLPMLRPRLSNAR